jgi:hypothetical protein
MKSLGKKIKTIQMSNETKPNGNSFSSFLLGVIVGGLIVFLLGTEKGKKILKIISEKGLDNISNILEKADRSISLDEIEEEENEAGEKQFQVKEPAGERPRARRFFRGISRHVN